MDVDKEHKVAPVEDDEEIEDDNNEKATSDLNGDGETEGIVMDVWFHSFLS
jgi:hypothetical protein